MHTRRRERVHLSYYGCRNIKLPRGIHGESKWRIQANAPYVSEAIREGWKAKLLEKMCLRIKDKTLMNFMLRKDWEHVACDWHTISTPHFVSLLNFLPSFLFLIIRWFFTNLFPLDLFRMSRAFQKISFLC